MSNKIKKHVQCPNCGSWVSPSSIVFTVRCKSCTSPLQIKTINSAIIAHVAKHGKPGPNTLVTITSEGEISVTEREESPV